MQILVTPPEACAVWEEVCEVVGFPPQSGILTHRQIMKSDALAEFLTCVDAAILGIEPVDATVLASAKKLKVISRFGVGTDSIDQNALRNKGIRLTNTPGAMALGVARHALMFLLAITSNLRAHCSLLSQGKWERIPNAAFEETRLGIIGMGAIGRQMAQLTRKLGFSVNGFCRSGFREEGVVSCNSLERLIRESDVVSLHLPLTSETRNLISGPVWQWLHGKSLINLSRGSVVNEKECLIALQKGMLKYYATDVFEQEPLAGISRQIVEHERVLATPHLAAMDAVTAKSMLRQALQNVVYSFKGENEKVRSYVV